MLNLKQFFKKSVLYKNKKDQMYGAKAMLDFKGNLYYGIQSYWKIKLK